MNGRAELWVSCGGAHGSANGQFKVLNDIAIDPTDGTLWVSDDENDRIQHFAAGGEFLGKFASCYDPGAVEVDAAGNVIVACSSANIIRKFSDSGATLKTIATFGKGDGQTYLPLDLALDGKGNLYVADTENDRVTKFDAEGNFEESFDTGAGSRPKGISVAPGGNIWVAESNQQRVSVLDSDGELRLRFGGQGAGEGQFAHPSDVAVDTHGFAWVADAVNDRVQVFNKRGEYVTEFGSSGAGPGQIDTDWWLRLAIDGKGNVYLTDQGNSRVQAWKFDDFLPAYKSTFGAHGSANGQFKVLNDIAIDPTDGTLWVSDDENDRIQHFAAASWPAIIFGPSPNRPKLAGARLDLARGKTERKKVPARPFAPASF